MCHDLRECTVAVALQHQDGAQHHLGHVASVWRNWHSIAMVIISRQSTMISVTAGIEALGKDKAMSACMHYRADVKMMSYLVHSYLTHLNMFGAEQDLSKLIMPRRL